jgi:hypothetical protein
MKASEIIVLALTGIALAFITVSTILTQSKVINSCEGFSGIGKGA